MKAKLMVAVTTSIASGFAMPVFSAGIEEIVVTATRRAENLQDVPISITALTEQALEDAGISSAVDLSTQTPGLTLQKNAGGLVAFIRGVGALDATAGQESSVAMYVDGVYRAAPYGNVFGFNNVERIEVLKGPQGTLFGRNATGGLIHVITKSPSQEAELKGSLSYGDYDTVEAKLYGSTGLTEQLAVNFALYHHDQGDGYGTNVDTGNDVYHTKETMMRTKVMFTPSDDTSVIFAADYSDSEGSQGAGKQFLPGVTGLDGVTTYTGNYHNLTGSIDPLVKADGYSLALTIEHDFGPVSIKSITADQNLSVEMDFDNDQTAVPIVDVNIDEQSYDTFTQEIQVLSNPDSAIQWIVGGFYLKDESGFDSPIGLGLFGAAFGGGGVGIQNQIETESISVFGEATVPLSEQTDLTLGVRYTEDERDIDGKTDILDSIQGKNVLLSIPSGSANEKFDEVTYRAMLSHRFSDNMMVYGSYSRGFKSGNFNTVDPLNEPFDPEILDAYEIGIKSDLSDRLRINASVFYYEYDDIQLTVFEGPTTRIVNAASAEVTGADFEITGVITDYFDVLVGLSVLDTEIKDFPDATYFLPAPVGSTQVDAQDASGNELPRAPDFTFNIMPTLTLPMADGELRASVSYYYSDGFWWDHQNFRGEDSYSLVNASVGWTAPSDKWGIRLFGANLLDEEYSAFTVAQGVGDSYAAAPPRTYGLEINFSM